MKSPIHRKRINERSSNGCTVVGAFLQCRTPLFLMLVLAAALYNRSRLPLLVNDESVAWTKDQSASQSHVTKSMRVGAPSTSAASNEPLTVSTVPINIIHPSMERLFVTNWDELASKWDRNTTFDDITQSTQHRYSPWPSLPPNHRIAIILHCSPKMGSSTLRFACKESLLDTCGIESRGQVDPDGYWNNTEFGEIIRHCDNTHHFCLRKGLFTKNAERFDNIVFFHLYPFRTYEEWTRSAFKQPWHRAGLLGCNRLKNLMDECKDKHGELSFEKYPKAKLSEVQPLFAHQVNELKEMHHIILYQFREIDDLLSSLSDRYKIPLLPGSNGTKNDSIRKEGSCDEAILDKFHDCFTDKLMKLP